MDSTNHTRLRVVHVITQLELGGAQRNTLYTVGHLRAADFDPVLVCGPGGILDPEATAGAWPTHFVAWLVRPVRPWNDAIAAISLYRLFREFKPHIVHTHSSKAGILGRVAAYLAGVPVIVHTFHGFGFTPDQPPWLYKLFIKLERLCALLSTHLVFVSQDNVDEAKALGIGNITPKSLIRSGISMEPSDLDGERPPAGRQRRGDAAYDGLRGEVNIPRDAWVVATVGNFKPQKNPMDLAKTAKSVITQDPAVHFLFVGDGELRAAVEDEVRASGIAPQVHFLGWRRDVPAILSASNCFLLTSLWEGLPRALVEAAMAGLPSVAYAVNGVKEILLDGETGFPIPPHDTLQAAEKILWLKNHPAEAKTMGLRARSLVEKEFDINTMVRQQENLYQTLYKSVPLKSYYEPLWAQLKSASPAPSEAEPVVPR